MAILFDATTSYGPDGSTSSTQSFACTVASDANYLEVSVLMQNARHVTGITYNGVSMTLIGKIENIGVRNLYVYRLVNPTIGSNNVSISCDNAEYMAAIATSYKGVNTSNPIGTSTTSSGSGASPSTSITTVNANSLVRDGIYDNVAYTPSAGQTARGSANRTGDSSYVLKTSERSTTSAGSYTNSWIGIGFWAQVVYELNEQPANSNGFLGFFNLIKNRIKI